MMSAKRTFVGSRACAVSITPRRGDPPAISSHLIASGRIRKISFTGSTAVGKQLAALAARELVPCTLELGGHTPVMVLDDADVEATVRALIAFKFECAGQSCNAPSRVFVHESIYASFVEALTAHMRDIRVGPGLDPTTTMGPLQHARRLQRAVRSLVEDAAASGAIVITDDSRRIPTEGFFFAPTPLTNVATSAAIRSEEPFEPLLIVDAFRTPAEAIERANQSRYGLAAFCFSSDIERVVIADAFGGFYNDDQMAIRAGAQKDGLFYIGAPRTPGFRSIREPARALSIGLVLSDGYVAWGDAMTVQYSGVAGRG